MKKIVVILLIMFLGLNTYGQMDRSISRTARRTGQTPEQQMERRNEMIEERKNEYINTFMSTLEGDDFQKEIIKQKIHSFYDEKLVLLKAPFERSFDRQQAIKQLEESHFVELKDIISESDMLKIKEMIKGEFDDKEVKKKKKRKNRKKDKN
jgi:hypothetical protein